MGVLDSDVPLDDSLQSCDILDSVCGPSPHTPVLCGALWELVPGLLERLRNTQPLSRLGSLYRLLASERVFQGLDLSEGRDHKWLPCDRIGVLVYYFVDASQASWPWVTSITPCAFFLSAVTGLKLYSMNQSLSINIFSTNLSSEKAARRRFDTICNLNITYFKRVRCFKTPYRVGPGGTLIFTPLWCRSRS